MGIFMENNRLCRGNLIFFVFWLVVWANHGTRRMIIIVDYIKMVVVLIISMLASRMQALKQISPSARPKQRRRENEKKPTKHSLVLVRSH